MADSPLSLTFSQGVPRSVEDDRRFWIGPERFEVPDFDNVEHLVAALARKGVLERDPVVLRASRVDKGFRRTARLLEDRQSS